MLSNWSKPIKRYARVQNCTLLTIGLISGLSLTACNLSTSNLSQETIQSQQQSGTNDQIRSDDVVARAVSSIDNMGSKTNKSDRYQSTQSNKSGIRSSDQEPTEQQIKDCTVRNGKYQKVGLRQSYQCVVRYSDAGQSCQDASNCQGACYVSQRLPVGIPNQVGQCAKTSHVFGCHQRIQNGVASNILCID